ncbi:MAG: carbohydrate kinase family protein [Planctomycetota bacterium]|jgi:sugar/nucleoside kinase (ribokinase family)
MDDGYDVIGIGCCAFDMVVEVDHYPGSDEKLGGRPMRWQGGGLTATALVAVARLGGSCAYVGPLGDDYFSQFCVDDFRREGVDTSLISRVRGTSVAVAIVVACPEAGTRMIVAGARDVPAFAPADVPEDVVRRTRVLHVDNYHPAAAVRAAELARSCGVTVTMDLEYGSDDVDSFLGLGDYVIVPRGFTQQRYGVETAQEGARALFEETAPQGSQAAVVTAGSRGSFAVWPGGALHQPAYRTNVVDTTGCGDVFHGAFALGLARGWAMEELLPFASAVAALKCRELGGRAGIPNEEEVREFLASAEPIA